MKKREMVVFIFFLCLGISPTHALTIEESVIVKPNSSALGHYIINNTVTLTQLTVNDTHAKFEGLDGNNQTVFEINATGDFIDTLCYGSSTCIIPQTSTNKSLYFTLDDIAPNYSGFVKSPTGSSLAGVYHTIYINVTDTNILSSVWVEIDSATNYTMTDDVGNRYNYTFVLHVVGTHTYKAYMNDSANNINNTNLISFEITAPTSPGGGGGSPYRPPPSKVEKDFNYTYYPPKIDIIANEGDTIEKYFTLQSNDSRVIYIDMKIECKGTDKLCEDIYFLKRRTLVDQEYNEGDKISNVFLTPYATGDVLYEINIPEKVDDFDEVLEAGFVLTDESGIVKKIPIEVRIVDPERIETPVEKLEVALDTEIFAVRESSVFPGGYSVRYLHGVALIGFIMFLLVSRKLFILLAKNKKKSKADGVDIFE